VLKFDPSSLNSTVGALDLEGPLESPEGKNLQEYTDQIIADTISASHLPFGASKRSRDRNHSIASVGIKASGFDMTPSGNVSTPLDKSMMLRRKLISHHKN